MIRLAMTNTEHTAAPPHWQSAYGYDDPYHFVLLRLYCRYVTHNQHSLNLSDDDPPIVFSSILASKSPETVAT